MRIVRVTGREILDSRGNPTIECEVELESGIIVSLPFHQAHQQARTRLLSFVTETLSATAERAFSRL